MMICSVSAINAGGDGLYLQVDKTRVRARVPEYRKFRRKSAISAGGGGVMRRKRRIDSAVSCTCSKSFEISGYPQAGAE